MSQLKLPDKSVINKQIVVVIPSGLPYCTVHVLIQIQAVLKRLGPFDCGIQAAMQEQKAIWTTVQGASIDRRLLQSSFLVLIKVRIVVNHPGRRRFLNRRQRRYIASVFMLDTLWQGEKIKGKV